MSRSSDHLIGSELKFSCESGACLCIRLFVSLVTSVVVYKGSFKAVVSAQEQSERSGIKIEILSWDRNPNP